MAGIGRNPYRDVAAAASKQVRDLIGGKQLAEKGLLTRTVIYMNDPFEIGTEPGTGARMMLGRIEVQLGDRLEDDDATFVLVLRPAIGKSDFSYRLVVHIRDGHVHQQRKGEPGLEDEHYVKSMVLPPVIPFLERLSESSELMPKAVLVDAKTGTPTPAAKAAPSNGNGTRHPQLCCYKCHKPLTAERIERLKRNRIPERFGDCDDCRHDDVRKMIVEDAAEAKQRS